MGKDDTTETKPRARPRKQFVSTKEVCTAPVIELTSSSDDEAAPPPSKSKVKLNRTNNTRTVTPLRRNLTFSPTKPPILGKRPSQTAVKPTTPKYVYQKELKSKKMSDTEKLLSILENDSDNDDLTILEKSKSASHSNLSEIVEDNFLESIEDELRHLHDSVDREAPALKPTQPEIVKVTTASKDVKKNTSVAGKVVSKSLINYPLKSVRETFDEAFASSRQQELHQKDNSINAVTTKKDQKVIVSDRIDAKFKGKTGKSVEKTRVLSPSEIQLPPEVLEAIKKRTNLGRIEKIVEKTDGNQKSKYIVIFNKGAAKKKGSVEDEIESLLKSLPPKPLPVKKTKLSDSNETELKRGVVKLPSTIAAKAPKEANAPLGSILPSKQMSFQKKPFGFEMMKDFNSLFEKKINTPVIRKFEERKSASVPLVAELKKPSLNQPPEKRKQPNLVREEPVRFTESPLSHEPWDLKSDGGFEKYFKIVERLVEHHDSLDDSDSDSNEPVMFSHFKNLDSDRVMTISKEVQPDDKISVNNIADTITREFPRWKVERVDGSDSICLVQMAMGVRARTSIKKQIKIDSDYNVSVIVDSMNIPEYEGMYDSFDNIKQLIFEIDQL